MSCTASEVDERLATPDLPLRIADVLRGGTRGAWGRARMSPEMSYGRHAGPAPSTARAAAVMLLLFRRGKKWHLPLTERPPGLLRHGGQMSLPGGAIDPGETAEEAARRELDEELGIATDVQMLGSLADCYVFASDFVVSPCVAAIDCEPLWLPHAHEVQGIVELSLSTLLDERVQSTTIIQRGPLVFRAPCLQLGTACVWGATAVILGELMDVLHRVLTDTPTSNK